MSDPERPFGTITARLEERILQPLRQNAFARRTQLSITLALILVLYATLLGWMLRRDAANPPKAQDAQETPIEVVSAMPPQPSVSAPAEVEKPATSAPRDVNESKADAGEDKSTQAPRAVAPTPAANDPGDVAPSDPSEAATVEPKAIPEQSAETPKPPDLLDRDAEALDKAPPEPAKKPEKLAAAKPVPKPPHRPKTALQQLAGSSDLPDYTFAKPMRKRAKVSGGSEDDRYLAVVYGMITQNRRRILAPDSDWSVAVSFVVDGGGNLVGVQVTKSSGYAQIDAAAVQSVEDAAPFPPPPSGNNTGLVARLRSLGSEAMAGDR